MDFYDINEILFPVDDLTTATVAINIDSGHGYGCDIFDFRINLTSSGVPLPAGYYRIKLTIKILDQYSATISESNYWTEPLDIQDSNLRPDLFKNTLQIKYQHEDNNKGMCFIDPAVPATTYFYYKRIQAIFKLEEKSLDSVSSVYTDQENDLVILDAIPTATDKLEIGGNGIPNGEAEIINAIFCCSYIFLRYLTDTYDDKGKQYVKKDGAKMEPISEKFFPLRVFSLEITDGVTNYDNTIEYLTW